jgi:hypothetical protein
MSRTLHAFVRHGLVHARANSEPLELVFNRPRSTPTVWVNVYAQNHWTTTAGANLPRDQRYLRAVITGRLEAGTFTRTKIAQYYDLALPTAHELKLMLYDDAPPPINESVGGNIVGRVEYLIIKHGNSESRVPIQKYEPEPRLAPFSVTLEVFAETDEGLAVQTLPAINIRPIELFRAELTFVAAYGDDFSDPTTTDYRTRALAYWRAIIDNQVVEELYLKRILEIVKLLPPRPRNNKPLGRLNIVSHGAESTWWIRQDSATDPPPGNIIGFDAKRMARLSDAAIPGEDVLDSESVLVVAACELGHDKALLEQIREQFGGLVRVYAPKLDVVYRDINGAPGECLAQVWRFLKPGAHDWPSAAETAARLEDAYQPDPKDTAAAASRKAQYSNYTTSDWAKVAAITSTDEKGDEIRFPAHVQPFPATLEGVERTDVFDGTSRKPDDELVKLVFSETDKPFALGLKFEVSVVPSGTNPETYTVTAIGRRTVFKLLRLLTDDKGAIATPELSNSTHYGSFP